MSRWQNPYNEKHFNGIQNRYSTVTLISLISTELFFLICLFEFFTEKKKRNCAHFTENKLHYNIFVTLRIYSAASKLFRNTDFISTLILNVTPIKYSYRNN